MLLEKPNIPIDWGIIDLRGRLKAKRCVQRLSHILNRCRPDVLAQLRLAQHHDRAGPHDPGLGLVGSGARHRRVLWWPAALAAALFGVSAAHVPTVAYAMAFTHVFGTFLIMLAVVTIDEALDHEHPGWWRAASVVCFAAAVAANEPVAVLAPLLALIAFWRCSQVRCS